jgi:hypothetical protein
MADGVGMWLPRGGRGLPRLPASAREREGKEAWRGLGCESELGRGSARAATGACARELGRAGLRERAKSEAPAHLGEEEFFFLFFNSFSRFSKRQQL